MARAPVASMVVDDLNVVSVAVSPSKADAPLIVDPNTMLACAIPSELLESIAWRPPQVVQLFGRVHQPKLAEHDALEVGRKAPHRFPTEKPFGVAISERVDHCP